MEEKYDAITAFFSGIIGSALAIHFELAQINWASIFENAGHMIWLGFVALFSGGMGVLGKHLITKYLNRKKK